MMCWWNDFPTYRDGGAADGRLQPRQHQAFDSASAREMTDSGATDKPVHRVSSTSSQSGDTENRKNLSGAETSAGFTSQEETSGTATTCSDIGSLWHTATSAGGVTVSDQFDLSAAFSVWDALSLQHYQHPPAPHPHQLPLLSPAAEAVEGLQSSSSMGGRCGTEAKSGSGESAGVSIFSTNFCGPSFLGGAAGANANVATYSRGGNFSSTTYTINDDKDRVVSGDINKAGKEGAVFDEADVGTISSLIAALQVRGTTNQSGGNASLAEGDEVKDPDDSNYGQHQPSGRDSRAPADSDRSFRATENPDTANQQPQSQQENGPNPVVSSLMPVFHDPNASTSVIASLNATQGSTRRYSSNVYNGNTSGNILGCNASLSSGFEVPLGETPSGTVASASGRAGPRASLRYQEGETAPLQLTPSTVHSALASFQCVLGEYSNNVTLPSSIGDLCDTTWRGTGSHNGDSSSGDMSVKMDTPAVSGNCSPAMRGRASSVVVHKLNLDGAMHRSGLQDLRGSGSFPPACVSPDSTCSSDILISLPSAQGRLSVQPLVYTQEREASPDSSVDHFFAQAASSVPSMLGLQQQVASSVTAERLGATHHHVRTASEVSISTAAATYSGVDAQQQRADDSGCVAVVDPQRRKLHVPLSAIQATKALNGRLKTPSLCLLYQSGRCRQSDNCYQVHVDPATVERLRADVKSLPCCCFQHGDCNSHLMDRKAYERRSLKIAGRFTVPLTSVAYTFGLQRVLHDQQVCTPINSSVLCRLHGQPGGCRFAADCRFVHICRDILQNELVGIMANAMAATAASAAMTAAQQNPQQSRVSNGSPFLVDLANNRSTSSSETVHGGSNAATLSINNAASSVMSAAEFSSSQLSGAVPVSTTTALSPFSICVPPSSKQQQSSTPSLVTMQPPPRADTLSASCVGSHYTLTTLPPVVSQAQMAVARPSPLQTSVPLSPPSACHAHVRTLSTQSDGTYPYYAALTFAQTPSHGEAASPVSMGLPAAHSSTSFPVATSATAGCIGDTLPSLAQRQFPCRTAPPLLHKPSSLVPPQFLHLQQHHRPSTSQQFYVQQINPDGSISLVPVSVIQDFGGGVF